MSSSVEVLEAGVLQLPVAERARLVERLIASLDADPEIAEAWAAEVERRPAQLGSGAPKLRPGPGTMAKLKAEVRGKIRFTALLGIGAIGSIATNHDCTK